MTASALKRVLEATGYKWAAMGVLLLAYPILAHYSTLKTSADMGTMLAVLPITAIAFSLAWRSPRRVLMLAFLGFALAVLGGSWGMLQQHFGWLYFFQHVGTHLALGLMFGLTLLNGRQALCSRFAVAIEHGILSPVVSRYTRQVTVAWTIYFVLMAVTSTLLFCLAPIEDWSIFANFLTPLLLLLMFLAEYCVRLHVLPQANHSSLIATVRVFWKLPLSPGRLD